MARKARAAIGSRSRRSNNRRDVENAIGISQERSFVAMVFDFGGLGHRRPGKIPRHHHTSVGDPGELGLLVCGQDIDPEGPLLLKVFAHVVRFEQPFHSGFDISGQDDL